MIVKCKDIYNEMTNQYYTGSNPDMCLSRGYSYNVLSIEFFKAQIYYRIISDSSGLYNFPILVRANEFEIITYAVPNNWGLDEHDLSLNPKKWFSEVLWVDGFWSDYDAALPMALDCYREEVKTIIATDKEYIQIMMDERANGEQFATWRESMLPLLNEIVSEG